MCGKNEKVPKIPKILQKNHFFNFDGILVKMDKNGQKWPKFRKFKNFDLDTAYRCKFDDLKKNDKNFAKFLVSWRR